MGDNQQKPSGYTNDEFGNQVPYFKESPVSNVVSTENQTINPSNVMANPAAIPSASANDAAIPSASANDAASTVVPPSYEAAVADVNAAPGVVAAAPPAPINVLTLATIEPNKPAIIKEVTTGAHYFQFEPAIDLVNPTAALNRLSYGINKIINAKAGDPKSLPDDYVAPATIPTYGQRAKNALKGVSGFLTRKNKVAPAPMDNSVINEMQPRVGGRRMNTKKNRKRRITRSNRKRVRPSRRR
jgi:hypothetical protein